MTLEIPPWIIATSSVVGVWWKMWTGKHAVMLSLTIPNYICGSREPNATHLYSVGLLNFFPWICTMISLKPYRIIPPFKYAQFICYLLLLWIGPLIVLFYFSSLLHSCKQCAMVCCYLLCTSLDIREFCHMPFSSHSNSQNIELF